MLLLYAHATVMVCIVFESDDAQQTTFSFKIIFAFRNLSCSRDTHLLKIREARLALQPNRTPMTLRGMPVRRRTHVSRVLLNTDMFLDALMVLQNRESSTSCSFRSAVMV